MQAIHKIRSTDTKSTIKPKLKSKLQLSKVDIFRVLLNK